MAYYEKHSGGGGFLLLIAIIVILVVIFIIWGSKIPIISSLHTKLLGNTFLDFKSTPTREYRELVLPPSTENDWCKIQTMIVGDSREDPISDAIIGWDNMDNCCVREVDGFDCALKRNIDIKYCFTGNIGGIIKYVMVDGYFGNVDNYKALIANLDKGQIENKPCDRVIYPSQLQI